MRLPVQYHKLKPFAEFFRQGVPILMYHKIGQRPPRTRLRGLYVTPDVFERQLAELRQAGFVSCTTSEARTNGVATPRITLSFDDGFRNVFENALKPLAQNQFRAIQFLVPSFIGKLNEWDLRDGEAPEPLMDAVQIREWLAAGHRVGSHSLSHHCLTRLTLRDAREEIFASKKSIEDTFGVAVEDFCYPYGDSNPSIRDLVAEAGYRTACTTQFGVNVPATPAFALFRITVRYPSRSLKALKARLMG
jgi:peptidoglycan/xylan/chitin deacetylase (PgdA/CDA1 family)